MRWLKWGVKELGMMEGVEGREEEDEEGEGDGDVEERGGGDGVYG